MFYRICVECEHPGMLFQMSLFRILQKFHLGPMAKSTQLTVSESIHLSIRWVSLRFFLRNSLNLQRGY